MASKKAAIPLRHGVIHFLSGFDTNAQNTVSTRCSNYVKNRDMLVLRVISTGKLYHSFSSSPMRLTAVYSTLPAY